MKRMILALAMAAGLCGPGAGVAGAQIGGNPGPIHFPGRWAAGASMAATATADRSNDFSPDIGVNIDRTIADGWSLRAEAGRVRWRFDGNPSLRTIPASETLTLTRLSLTAIAGLPHRHPSGAGRPYVGAGVGYYHYGLERNALTAPNQLGVQLVGGVEILPPRSRFSVRVEAQLQLVGGPYAPPDNPAVVPAPRSHFVSDQVLNLRMGVGVSRRF